MLDSIIRSYATRHLTAIAVAVALAVPAAIWGGTVARTPDTTVVSAGAALQGAPRVDGVARVIDGDTLEIGNTRIRLEGIDAPEGDQACARAGGGTWPCGPAASSELQRLIGRASLRCEGRGLDKYGRLLAICFNGATDINAEMVKRGYAWAFVKYSKTYVAEEADARGRSAGVWQAPTTTAWDHRAGRWAEAAGGRATAPSDGKCPIKGNITSSGRIYHMPWSPWYDKVRIEPEKGERWFCTESEAMAAGWRPVRVN
jgi:endonuclease YncB( thermonuclease family)